MDYDVTNPRSTTLEATHLLDPSPADGLTVSAGHTQLQWTLPEPSVPGGTVTCDVYFGTNPDVEANPKVVEGLAVESVGVTLASNTVYYWALDVYDSIWSPSEPYYAPIFIIDTFNTAPTADAGSDLETWLVGGTKVVELNGSGSDKETPGALSYQWVVIDEPNNVSNPALITHPNPSEPDATVTVTLVGTYTLELVVDDGDLSSEPDTMKIVLYANSCDHAKDQPGFEQLAGDTNDNCKVDLFDLANLGASWLEENYSTQ